jgi:hypothetical protein
MKMRVEGLDQYKNLNEIPVHVRDKVEEEIAKKMGDSLNPNDEKKPEKHYPNYGEGSKVVFQNKITGIVINFTMPMDARDPHEYNVLICEAPAIQTWVETTGVKEQDLQPVHPPTKETLAMVKKWKDYQLEKDMDVLVPKNH